ncbi:aldo/keto reductase [Actinocorallia longicatena]|uniref:Aldo/keto reductase n=1 Tax=Actinocorallia longicatena TaxID=111803 RepID=A0ABP6QC51_9ACTN
MSASPTSEFFDLGGDLRVRRLGFGAMRITGEGIWGEPADRDEAIRVLRRAVEAGVTLIDTADSYGPFVSEDLIREALHPYADDLVIATKGGLTRHGPGIWAPVGRPEYLRQAVEMSLRRLGLERIDLYQLHRIDPQVPVEDQLGELAALQKEGKIRHLGLSEVSVAELRHARGLAEIVSVQNLYNLTNRQSEDVLEYATAEGIGFIPWFPLATGELAGPGSVLAEAAERHGASPARLALAWLLHRSPAVLPIPGTSRVAHLEDNLAAGDITLTDEEVAALTALA